MKTEIGSVTTLANFDKSRRTRLIADASRVALGAVLVQFEDENVLVIGYASKSLTDTEKRYCQTELEALALVWAVEKFDFYLFGITFELETDHKPLEVIFSPESRPCPRIERWVLRLQPYRYEVVYKQGKSNVADPLSRLVVNDIAEPFDPECEVYIRHIVESAAIDVSEIEEVSEKDKELAAVREALITGKWDSPEVEKYRLMRDEFISSGDLVIRGMKVVIPEVLRPQMLVLGHEGHPGEVVMKRRLRDRVWWPGMDLDISKFVKSCRGCLMVSQPNPPEPMRRRPLPNEAWIDVALDFMGPLPSGEYLLVIVDYFSRYKEVRAMRKITSEATWNELEPIFVRLGFPRTITLDNGRQFVSEKFRNLCKHHGIFLNFSTPYWPQENGQVERQNRSLLKRLKISYNMGRDWKKDMNDYLLMYYTTPHSVTGKTPSEMLMKRTIRSKIPQFTDIETKPLDSDYAEKDKLSKQKGKEKGDENRRARTSECQVGDLVWMKNLLPQHKLSPNVIPRDLEVVDKAGARVLVEDVETGKQYQRNAAHLVQVPEESEGCLVNDADKDHPEIDVDNGTEEERNKTETEFRKSGRNRKPPGRYVDYVP